MVVGCVQRASDALGSGAGASTSAADQFLLTSARMSSANTPGAGISGRASGQADSGAPGASGAPGTATSNPRRTFMLEGQASELRDQVGHQVEITGRLEPIGSTGGTRGAAGSPDAAGSAGTSSSGSSTSPAEKLQVQSVRMIAMSCSGT
jgi:hypothetical protein